MTMLPEQAMVLALLVPLVGAVLIALASRTPNVREGITPE